jgi:hypothetical protein
VRIDVLFSCASEYMATWPSQSPDCDRPNRQKDDPVPVISQLPAPMNAILG